MGKQLSSILILFVVTGWLINASAEKSIYIPSSFSDPNNASSKWSYSRSLQSDNFILFWEAGYGANPSTTTNSSYRVDLNALLNIAEKSFEIYRDSLKFIIEGNSKTDTYKMIILLNYTTTWQATGSGVDDQIGLLNLSANAAQAMGVTVAHEVGHCFQYQVHCDGHTGGWMYGFGTNGAGGNGWWEQCAQWQAFKVLPDEQFSNYQFNNYLNTCHKNLLHEEPRYANYFIQDYWTYLRGANFIGQLWRNSKYPEDPVEAYKRLNGITQKEFNDEIYDCAARFVTWDVPSIKSYGKNYIDSRQSSSMTLTEEGYWLIDSTDCVENYGYNTIRLNAPDPGVPVKLYFEGKAGTSGYRALYNKSKAGWRYGFVALLDDGRRVYSDMGSSSFIAEYSNPKDTITFTCPDNCIKLWLVVAGAPSIHWPHEWDDDSADDEQWPYQVKFENTNIYGVFNFNDDDEPYDVTLTQNMTLKPVTQNTNPYPSTPIQPNWESVCRAFRMQFSEIKSEFGKSIKYCAYTPSWTANYSSTANAPGHWFSKYSFPTTWGNSGSFVFSEFHINNLIFNIGQYPSRCKEGDKVTIRQGLEYKTELGATVKAKFIFNITITNEVPSAIEEAIIHKQTSTICNTVVSDYLKFNTRINNIIVRNIYGVIVKQEGYTSNIYLGNLADGIYLVSADGVTNKIIKVAK